MNRNRIRARINTGRSISNSVDLSTINASDLNDADTAFTINILSDNGSDLIQLLDNNNLSIVGAEGLETSINQEANTLTVALQKATTTTLGGAAFNSSFFEVDDGVVSIKQSSIAAPDSSITLGNKNISLGASTNTLEGLLSLQVGNIEIIDNKIISSNNILDVNNSAISNVADPIYPNDAANKAYVDKAAAGLVVRPAVAAATTENLNGTYTNGNSGVGATLELPAAEILNIDGYTNWELDLGILVKDQINQEENGRYFVSQIGDATTPWILTRCISCDESSEIPSSYIFVQEGNYNEGTGWVANVENFNSFSVGVHNIIFEQFSGSGTYSANGGIDISDSVFSIKTGPGIRVESDLVQIDSSIAGSGLSFTNGTISVVGSPNRIAINSDSIDISQDYIGQNSITTVGNIQTGSWNADTIETSSGGTGIANYSKGDILYASNDQSLQKLSIGNIGNIMSISESGVPVWTNEIDGGTF